VYGTDVAGPLTKIWAALDGPAGKRLAPFMAEVIEASERHGERALTEVRGSSFGSRPPRIDRLLAPQRRRLLVKGRPGTKPASILKRQIPIRTFAEWDEARPGFCEVELDRTARRSLHFGAPRYTVPTIIGTSRRGICLKGTRMA
jgi:hypothetical protein